MANNNNIYNAVIAGASGGNQQRWITDTSSGDYAEFRSIVEVIATAVDAAITPISGDASTAQAALMQSIVQGVFSDRFVQSGSQVVYNAIVNAIVALYSSLNASLEPAAGSSSDPLVSAYYADSQTAVLPANQTGFIGAPFDSLEDAYDAAFAASGDLGFMPMILAAPGSYLGFEDPEGVGISIKTLGVIAPNGDGVNITGDLVGGNGTAWLLDGITVIGDISTTATVNLRQSGLTGTITCDNSQCFDCPIQSIAIECNTLTARNCHGFTNISIIANPTTGSLKLDDCDAGTITATDSNIVAEYSTINQITDALNISLSWCNIGNELVATNDVTIVDCNLFGVVTVGGDLTIDTASYQRALTNGVVFTVTGTIIFSDDPQSITVTGAVVPAVAADAVGYLDVSLVGTALEGLLTTNDPVIVNPQSDLVAAGAGGGLLNARVSAADTVRLCFQGALAGGAANFTITRVR